VEADGMDNSRTEGVQGIKVGVTTICDYELLKATNKRRKRDQA